MTSAGPLPSRAPTLSRISGPTTGSSANTRVDDLPLQLLVALEHEAEDGGQRQQQRKDREEGVVRDQRREPAGTVVGELPAYRQRERDGGVAPLPFVDDATERCRSQKTVAQSLLTLTTVQRSVAAWSSACSAPPV
jgi:hypothetical protein